MVSGLEHRYYYCLERYFLSLLRCAACLQMEEVQPTFMVNPGVIWVRFKPDTAYEKCLTEIMRQKERNTRMAFDSLWHTPSVGELVMLWCPKAKVWGRAQIQKIFLYPMHEPDSTVDVFFIDYGTSATAKLIHVRKLPEDPKFSEPGKACKLILFGLVPITKIPLFTPEKGTYGLHDTYSKVWDRSTFDFMSVILETDTQFFVTVFDFHYGKTTVLGNRVWHGELLMLVDGKHQSISGKLITEKYGVRNLECFEEFFVNPKEEEPDLIMKPDKPLCAQVWQRDVDMLIETTLVHFEDLCTPDGEERMHPFEASPEEIELARDAAEACAKKVKEADEKVQALSDSLKNQQLRSEKLKEIYRPPSFADRVKFLLEEENLRNSAKELVGLVPNWEELSSEEESVVHYRTIYNPKSIYVMLSKNIEPFEMLQKEIASFAARHPWLLGQVRTKAGAYCLALFPEDKAWYRARVVDMWPDRKVEVFFLDVGDDAVLDAYTEVLPISKGLLMMLPFQAIECSLFGVEPLDGEDWPEEAVEEVHQYCVDEADVPLNLSATLYSTQQAQFSGGTNFQVVLSHNDGTASQVVSLNEKLLQLPGVQRA